MAAARGSTWGSLRLCDMIVVLYECIDEKKEKRNNANVYTARQRSAVSFHHREENSFW